MSQDDKLNHIIRQLQAQGWLLCEIADAVGAGVASQKLGEATLRLKQHTDALQAALDSVPHS
jgi:hypothetical protein